MALHLSKRIRNAWRAFRPDEIGYKLAIDKFSGFDVAFRKGTADERVIAHSFDNDIFLRGVPEYQPKDDHIILDVGAHIGTLALLAASHLRSGRVHAIEASQESFDYLRLNAALNPKLPVTTHHLALAGHDGTVTLHHDRKNWGHSIMKQLSSGGESVPAMSLTSFMTKFAIERIDFMKFNCEGAEFPILLNTPVNDLKRVAAMLVLYHVDLAEGYRLGTLTEHLQAAGFRPESRNVEGDRGWLVCTR